MNKPLYLTKFPMHVALARDDVAKPGRGWNPADPVFRHRAVMGLFGDLFTDSPRAETDALFRLDLIPGEPAFFLVQSTARPDFEHPAIETVEYTLPSYAEGTPVRFRIAVNAVRRQNKEKAVPSQDSRGVIPVPFDGEENDDDVSPMSLWLQRKLHPALKELQIINHQREVLGVDRDGRRFSDRVVQVDTVDGVAQIGDVEVLHTMMAHGVGRAKNYGCGLLSVQAI
ncbi:CRISPR system Cascade subunit CasE [Arcanobacterium pluranimalium]|uniref:type I-E CRISPR-associated protein Cas6/Cse3/CasE n=1 Tax=Arcanobacterium pluranimalium TaxID=108028 RepID=UPI00195E4E27|nr:type I-E CRISPR-associated protein Cas6/Cse3/CasE [Arcanobacterium pluranimalium]MBM7824571.1 CRISPR system Cascade subunit CasE [Arcanobacterium pluranimalium]